MAAESEPVIESNIVELRSSTVRRTGVVRICMATGEACEYDESMDTLSAELPIAESDVFGDAERVLDHMRSASSCPGPREVDAGGIDSICGHPNLTSMRSLVRTIAAAREWESESLTIGIKHKRKK